MVSLGFLQGTSSDVEQAATVTRGRRVATHRSVSRLRCILGSCTVDDRHDIIIFLVAKVFLDNLRSRLVNILILVILQLLEHVDSAVSLRDDGVLIETVLHEMGLAGLQDVI